MYETHYKEKAVALRRQGKTYGEIQKTLGRKIPKSTLSCWCDGILLSKLQHQRIKTHADKKIHKGRLLALAVNKVRREKYLKSIDLRIARLAKTIEHNDVKKIAAAMLYLGEGSKVRSTVAFGNSNPDIIKLFLNLLRSAYKIDEAKFRCTVLCRADHDTAKLEKFWAQITKIPSTQFYKTRIDPRTIGKPSKKPNYMGVCVIDYFSADLFIELTRIGQLICSKS